MTKNKLFCEPKLRHLFFSVIYDTISADIYSGRKNMTKATRNILLAIVAFLIIVNVVSLLMRRGDDGNAGDAGRITVSDTSVRINGELIPSYGFREMVYIAAQDLRLFGFEVEEDASARSCNITKTDGSYSVNEEYRTRLSNIPDGTAVSFRNYKTFLNGTEIQGYGAGEYIIIPIDTLAGLGSVRQSQSGNTIEFTFGTDEPEKPVGTPSEVSVTPPTVAPAGTDTGPAGLGGKVIVLDPGHGAASDSMSDDEKRASGWVRNESGSWGEWRHWKSGTVWQDCGGSGCSGRAPENGGCWYPIGNGDRDTEPDINLQNCLAAKKYLEELGYTVRLTRTSNDENPSITERIKNCYPNGDTSKTPDALAYVCVHSNAGGGSGSAYIALDGTYDQAGIAAGYANDGNALGKSINDRIVSSTSLGEYSGGRIDGQGSLILFCKSPVICGYLEIGFFDNSSDLAVLKSESDAIGKAIADGINDYFAGT